MQTVSEKWREASSKLREIRAMLNECPTKDVDDHTVALLKVADELEANAGEYEHMNA